MAKSVQVVGFLGACFALSQACSATPHDLTNPSVGDPDAGIPFVTPDAADGGGTQPTFCSGDLRNVIDGDGVIQKACPPELGCARGECVPACDAAGASQGSIGCDYVVATPAFYRSVKGPCFAAFATNNWPLPVLLAVSRAGTTYDVTKFGRIAETGKSESEWQPVPTTGVPPGKVAVLFLSDDPTSASGTPLTCPIEPALRTENGTALARVENGDVTGRGKAWHIQASYPVTMYDVLPYGGAPSLLPSAELLFPTTAWGTNYFGVVPPRGISSPQWGQLVAAHDETHVTVRPNVDLPTGTDVAQAKASELTNYTLNAGDYIQWEDSGEMSGTVIKSDKPVSFTGGLGDACYASATSNGGGCDSAHQQTMPISAWGSEYAVAPYLARFKTPSDAGESIRYRFVGSASGTKLSYSPAVSGAPTVLGKGQVVDFETVGPFVVKSQDNAHPFFVGQVMSGAFGTGEFRLGDEEFVNVLPPAQFLAKYVFFTDPTYKTTNLVFVRQKVAQGFLNVKLDCAGTLTGWKPLGADGRYEFTYVDLVRLGAPAGTCNNGPHAAESAAPFGLVVWGLDETASYAYPAGGNATPINAVVVNPAVPN